MDKKVLEEAYIKEVFNRPAFETENAQRVAKATKVLSFILNRTTILDESMKGKIITILLDHRELVRDAFKDFPGR